MTKREFTELYEYLQELYDLKELSKRGFYAWFKVFEKIDNDVANKMVDLYFLNNSKRPKPADILGYRNYATKLLNKTNDITISEQCDICEGAGAVVIERKKDGDFYQYGYACICSNGEKFSFLKKFDFEELNNPKKLRYVRGKWTEMTLEEEQQIYCSLEERAKNWEKYK